MTLHQLLWPEAMGYSTGGVRQGTGSESAQFAHRGIGEGSVMGCGTWPTGTHLGRPHLGSICSRLGAELLREPTLKYIVSHIVLDN